MARITGFSEWLPEQELIQREIISTVQETFELHGFTPLQTRSVELLDDLLSQGETDKEIYGVGRLNGRSVGDVEWGLHYDLTVPFARYVREHQGKLTFPFRRYQIQQAWRGERPQLGRFREFLQADADIIVEGELDLRHDAEMLILLRKVTARLPVGPITLLVNNRKVLQGFYDGLGVPDVAAALRIMDKLAKVGPERTVQSLGEIGLPSADAHACIALGEIEASTAEGLDAIADLGVSSPLLSQGVSELKYVLDRLNEDAGVGGVRAALHIARGLDYYTGTVVEGVLDDHADLGAVCSGGRYDSLAAAGSKRPLPGVGISVGISRLLAFAFHFGLLEPRRRTPAQVLVAVVSEEERWRSEQIADALRQRGISCLVSDRADAFGKQIRTADRLGVTYVWFPTVAGGTDEVKNIDSGEQVPAHRDTWELPPH